MNERSKQTTNKLIQTLDLPQDLFLGYANLSLCGNRELYISNHRGILSYGQEEIVILTKELQIQIKGKELDIASYTKDELTIRGIIRSLEFI